MQSPSRHSLAHVSNAFHDVPLGLHTSIVLPAQRRLSGAQVSGLQAPAVHPVAQYCTKLHIDPSDAHASTAFPEQRSVPAAHSVHRPASQPNEHVSVVVQAVPPGSQICAFRPSQRRSSGVHT